MSTTDIGISVSKDSSTKMKSETCLWGVAPETEAQVMKKLAEAAQLVIISRKEE